MPVYALGDLTPSIDPAAYVHPDAVLIGAVILGPEASVWPGAVLRGDMGKIVVGARTSIQDNTVLHTTRDWPTVIGADCVIGHAAHLEGCLVEDRCLIGSGSVVLNRASIGADSVLGAQALVPEDTIVPPGTMMLGVPARSRPLDPHEQAGWIAYGVGEYRANARRFRDQLRLIERADSNLQQGEHMTATNATAPPTGRPARELSDDELERQGKAAHDTRNWVFLNGTAEQFATHTARMLELEQEYLRRHPKRTWQGSGGAPAEQSELDFLKQALRGVLVQLNALVEYEPPARDETSLDQPADPGLALLARIAAAPGGRLHKLEVHQAAREVGLDRSALARLYTAEPSLLVTEQHDRVLTDAGRARLAAGAARSGGVA